MAVNIYARTKEVPRLPGAPRGCPRRRHASLARGSTDAGRGPRRMEWCRRRRSWRRRRSECSPHRDWTSSSPAACSRRRRRRAGLASRARGRRRGRLGATTEPMAARAAGGMGGGAPPRRASPMLARPAAPSAPAPGRRGDAAWTARRPRPRARARATLRASGSTGASWASAPWRSWPAHWCRPWCRRAACASPTCPQPRGQPWSRRSC